MGSTSQDIIFKLDTALITESYGARHHLYDSLLQEAAFILEEQISAEKIKIHAVERRIKALDSLLDKCVRKNTNDPFSEFDDIAGARVICLFRADLDNIAKIIKNNFDVLSTDDKILQGGNPLGYLSVHYTCRMKKEYSGPRYQRIANLKVEIQVRTLCMHCWAAVSHYLDYKGDWDVPADLKMALNALGGLFYVADNQFEQFYSARIESQARAETLIPQARAENLIPTVPQPATEINLDTITAYLRAKFPDREGSSTPDYSELVQELKSAGYDSIDEVDRDINRADEALAAFESHTKRGMPGHKAKFYFAGVGAARISLALASDKFFQQRPYGSIGRLLEFRPRVKPPEPDPNSR